MTIDVIFIIGGPVEKDIEPQQTIQGKQKRKQCR